jgi:hypothetical protein
VRTVPDRRTGHRDGVGRSLRRRGGRLNAAVGDLFVGPIGRDVGIEPDEHVVVVRHDGLPIAANRKTAGKLANAIGDPLSAVPITAAVRLSVPGAIQASHAIPSVMRCGTSCSGSRIGIFC